MEKNVPRKKAKYLFMHYNTDSAVCCGKNKQECRHCARHYMFLDWITNYKDELRYAVAPKITKDGCPNHQYPF